MVILPNTVLYNHMIIIGIYHRWNNHLYCEKIISIDILTAHESCASVNGFSVINVNHYTNNFTYQNNCYSYVKQSLYSSLILTYD